MADKENNSRAGEPVLTFPCDFTLKIIGRASNKFEGEAVAILRNHFPNLGEAAIRLKSSKGSKYLALSATVHALSQNQLDALYSDLSSNPHIIFVL